MPTAQAARSEFFGVNQFAPMDDTDLQAASTVGVKTVRFLLGWDKVQPSSGSFKWGPIDQLIGGQASHGIRGLPFLWASPPWAGTGATSRPPVNTASAKQAWGDFLKAAVNRYGRGGTYWTNQYPQQFGQGAVPVPITAWQIWNEPNHPWNAGGQTTEQAAHEYAELLHISHDAITSEDPQATIVTAGILRNPNQYAFDFLDAFYSVPGIKGDFDVLALHPYEGKVYQVNNDIQMARQVMANHGDQATPLWITEAGGWASTPPDGYCPPPGDCTWINVGLQGQAQLLTALNESILANREAWNVQRLYWFDWRDPAPDSSYFNACRRCPAAGLLSYDRTPKPAFDAFAAFSAETTPPLTSITSGPGQGALMNDPTPRFSFTSNEPGSTFVCRIDAGAFAPCDSPYTAPALADGSHSFSVKAIDAAGNESSVVSRWFTVDTVPPQVTIYSGPWGTTNDPTPTFGFSSSEAASSFRCTVDSGFYAACSPPFTTARLADGSHSFAIKATDAAGNESSVVSRSYAVRTAAVSVSGSTLTVTAADGAMDNLVITPHPHRSKLRVTDLPSGPYTGSGVHTGPGCTRRGDYAANCRATGVTLIRVLAGGQDDRVVNSTAIGSWLNGGPGDDALQGGSAADTLTGGPGIDVLQGMNGDDLLQARDLASDQAIDCGDGADKADLDLLPMDPNYVVTGCPTKARH